uniref:Tyr recombinase domain-containing protein n=1 Tax=Lygus hesperus TaxID=30085 RepID=A0A146LBF3_LYGHE
MCVLAIRNTTEPCNVPSETPTTPCVVSPLKPTTSRTSGICSCHSSLGETNAETTTTGLSRPPAGSALSSCTNSKVSTGSNRMVEKPYQRQQPLLPPNKKSLPVNRCIRLGDGGNVGPASPIISMEAQTATLVHQSSGTLCSSLGNFDCPRNSTGQLSPPSNRQQDSGSLHQAPRGIKIISHASGDSSPSQTSPGAQYPPTTSLHSRQIQHPGRPALQGCTTTRMALTTLNHTQGLSKVGDTIDRSICISQVSRGPSLCLDRPKRCQSNVCRCLLTNMELSIGLDIPTSTANPSGTASPEFCDRDISASVSPVDQDILATRHQNQGNRCPNASDRPTLPPARPINELCPTQCGRNGAGDLETTGWSAHLANWSDSERALLTAAWRPSTKSSYRQPWIRWRQWAEDHSIDPLRPPPTALARFLAHLHTNLQLAPASIAVHKSVIATWSDPENSVHLTSHPIVRRMMKGINSSQPRKEIRTVWDVAKLRDWIQENPPDNTSFFQVSRHVAVLLLLMSGRRVHDLTLLQVDAGHLQIISPDLVFWPQFGAKTDRPSFQQSGWRLSPDPNNPLWDVVSWVQLLLRLRRLRCGTMPIHNLFVSSRGRVKPASRAVIAKWVATALNAAGIEATPGSFRSAVNSHLARSHMPIDDILSRANWRSSDTFLRHYYRPISAPAKKDVAQDPTASFRPMA